MSWEGGMEGREGGRKDGRKEGGWRVEDEGWRVRGGGRGSEELGR